MKIPLATVLYTEAKAGNKKTVSNHANFGSCQKTSPKSHPSSTERIKKRPSAHLTHPTPKQPVSAKPTDSRGSKF